MTDDTNYKTMVKLLFCPWYCKKVFIISMKFEELLFY